VGAILAGPVAAGDGVIGQHDGAPDGTGEAGVFESDVGPAGALRHGVGGFAAFEDEGVCGDDHQAGVCDLRFILVRNAGPQALFGGPYAFVFHAT
jgi:hypothetical protein